MRVNWLNLFTVQTVIIKNKLNGLQKAVNMISIWLKEMIYTLGE